MSLHAYEAKKIFDDAKQHINPQDDPLMWDLVNGLSESCEAVSALDNRLDGIALRISKR